MSTWTLRIYNSAIKILISERSFYTHPTASLYPLSFLYAESSFSISTRHSILRGHLYFCVTFLTVVLIITTSFYETDKEAQITVNSNFPSWGGARSAMLDHSSTIDQDYIKQVCQTSDACSPVLLSVRSRVAPSSHFSRCERALSEQLHKL